MADCAHAHGQETSTRRVLVCAKVSAWSTHSDHCPNRHPALESRVLVGYVVALSALVLAFQRLHRTQAVRRLRERVFGPEEIVLNANYVPEGGYVTRHGGGVILSFQSTRVVANITLVVLSILKYVSERDSATATILLATVSLRTSFFSFISAHLAQVYAALVSTMLLVKPISQSRRFSAHATLSNFAILACYTYRDVWPALTFTLRPADDYPLFWPFFTLVCLTGLIIPLCEPYPYIPYDPAAPQPKPSPEQTASLLSLCSFAVLDPVILASTRVEHLGLDMLPPQMDTDNLAALKPMAYRFLDPFHRAEARGGAPRRVNVMWGLLATFRGLWTVQAVLYMVGPLARVAIPVGTNRLLAYLERGGEDPIVRPWVWVAWIGIAPFVSDLISTLNMYLNTRLYCQLEALITALVYDHALRVRIIHRPKENDGLDARGTSSGEAFAGVGVPDLTTSTRSVVTTTSGPNGASSSTTVETSSLAGSSVTGTTAVSSAPESSNGKAERQNKKDKKVDNKQQDKSKDLLGRLNNLITSDLANIQGGSNFLAPLIETPLLVVFGSWFLWSLLGSAAWVGLAVMAALLPVPAWTGKLINNVQKVIVHALPHHSLLTPFHDRKK